MLNEVGLGGRRREDKAPQSAGAIDLVIMEFKCRESEITEIKIGVQGQKRYRLIKLVLILQYLVFSINSVGTGRLAVFYKMSPRCWLVFLWSWQRCLISRSLDFLMCDL